MLKRLDVGGALTAATPVIYKLYLNTDNADYYNLDGATPTQGVGGVKFHLIGVYLTIDKAAKVEIGMTNTGKGSFTPALTIRVGDAPGPIVFDLRSDPPELDFTHATINFLAIRVTAVASATQFVAGAIELKRGF